MLRNVRELRYILVIGGALLTGLVCAHPALGQSGDPVEDLRDALIIQLEERDNRAALDLREKTLEQRIAALRTLNQLRRALVLTEWKDDPRENPQLRRIDLTARKLIADRMLNALNKALGEKSKKAPDGKAQPLPQVDVRIAAATFVGELDTAIRSASALDHRGLAREMTDTLAKVVETDPDTRVRQAAARGLGKINPDPETAAKALEALMLRKGRSASDALAEKRAAAAALLDMIQVVGKLYKTGQTQRGVLATPGEVVDVAAKIVPVAAIGARESDPQVRQNGVDTLLQCAVALNQVVPDPYLKTDFPTNTERELTESELRKIRIATDAVKGEQAMFLPLMKALGKEGETLARDMGDPVDPSVRLFSRQTFEMMATARQRLQRRLESVPVIKTKAKEAVEKSVKNPALGAEESEPDNEIAFLDGERKNGLEDDPLLQGLKPGVEVISAGLRDPDADIRLASVQFLEMLGRDLRTFPTAIGMLASNGLCDRSLFVRWASARTLVWAAPRQADVVVPALARDLQDTELEVRIASAYTLGLYGKLAEPAIPQLIQATAVGDSEGREAVIQTLAKIVSRPNEGVVMALIAALKNDDPRVRREASAALGQLGPNALLAGVASAEEQPAIRALEFALRDQDNDVRQFASEALLAIRVPLSPD